MESVPTGEMSTFIPTPKTTHKSFTELFCISTHHCPLAENHSYWHGALNSSAQLGFQLLLIHYMLTGLINFCPSSSICPQFSQLLILQNL